MPSCAPARGAGAPLHPLCALPRGAPAAGRRPRVFDLSSRLCRWTASVLLCAYRHTTDPASAAPGAANRRRRAPPSRRKPPARAAHHARARARPRSPPAPDRGEASTCPLRHARPAAPALPATHALPLLLSPPRMPCRSKKAPAFGIMRSKTPPSAAAFQSARAAPRAAGAPAPCAGTRCTRPPRPQAAPRAAPTPRALGAVRRGPALFRAQPFSVRYQSLPLAAASMHNSAPTLTPPISEL